MRQLETAKFSCRALGWEHSRAGQFWRRMREMVKERFGVSRVQVTQLTKIRMPAVPAGGKSGWKAWIYTI